MKIGVDARVLMDKHYSGVSEYAANLLTAILEQDYDNKYHLFYNNRRNQQERLSPWKRDNSQIRGTRYPNKIFNYCLQKILAKPKLDLFLKGTDIFFSPHFNFTRLSQQTKFVITIHDLSFLRYREFFSQRKNFWHRSLGLEKLLHRADCLVAVSENTKADIIELMGIEPEKIKVIYSGNNYHNLANSEVRPDDGDVEYVAKNNLRPGFILFLGNIEPRKNIKGLISAYENLRRLHPNLKQQLVLAGGQGWKNRQIFSFWRKSPYREDIKFLGYVSKQEKETLYRQAGAFVYPSFYEGFGFPPLEAMSFGVPVVSSNVSSLPEIIGGAALLVDPFRPEEIGEALALILEDSEIRADLIARGRRRAAEFSWVKTAREYLDLFKELYERKG